MLTIVSGSNDIFFPCLKQLLDNLKKNTPEVSE